MLDRFNNPSYVQYSIINDAKTLFEPQFKIDSLGKPLVGALDLRHGVLSPP